MDWIVTLSNMPDIIATETSFDSCLATLYLNDSVAELEFCEMEQVVLPATEKAETLGYGVWLVRSSTTAYISCESDTQSTITSCVVKHPGCQICILTFKCGELLSENNKKIRSDLGTCEQLPALKKSYIPWTTTGIVERTS